VAEQPAEHTAPQRRRRRFFQRNGESSELDADPAIGEQERLILEALADVRDMEVREVMTPRVDVVALSIPVHAQDVARAVRESSHSCFPVVHDDLDDVVGVLFVNDLFRSGWRNDQEDGDEPSPLDISRRLRQPYLLPESLNVLDALVEMRRHRRAFALVVDEYGGVAGVLTIKDLLEPLVGELHDELDAAEEPSIVRVDGSRWLVDGRTNVDDVVERLDIEIPEGEYVTLGGYLFDGFGHIPEEGESLVVGGWELRVVEMDKRRIAKVVARRTRLEALDTGSDTEPSEPTTATDSGTRPSAGRSDNGVPSEGSHRSE